MLMHRNQGNNLRQYFLASECTSLVVVNLSPVPRTFSGPFEVPHRELQNEHISTFLAFNFDSFTFEKYVCHIWLFS